MNGDTPIPLKPNNHDHKSLVSLATCGEEIGVGEAIKEVAAESAIDAAVLGAAGAVLGALVVPSLVGLEGRLAVSFTRKRGLFTTITLWAPVKRGNCSTEALSRVRLAINLIDGPLGRFQFKHDLRQGSFTNERVSPL